MQSLWMLVASVMFACMSAGVKYSLDYGAPLAMVVLFRALPSVIGIATWAILTQHTLKTAHPFAHFKRNLFGTTSLWLSFLSLGILPLATSTSLNYTSSLFIGLYVVFATGQLHKNMGRLLTVLLGFAGVLLILKPSIHEGQWLGAVAGVLAGLTAAFAMFQVKSLGRLGEPVWRTVFYFSLVACLSGIVMIEPDDIYRQSWMTWFSLIVTGLFGMCGQLALTQAYGAGSPIMAAVLQYSTIIFATILGFIFWDVIPDAIAWIGMGMVILAGVGIVAFDQRKP